MQAASWNDVWNLFLSVFTHQPIPVQIAIGLVAALAALMIIEGLRASFFPQRRAEAIKPARLPQPVTIEPETIQQAMPAAPMRSFAVSSRSARRVFPGAMLRGHERRKRRDRR